MYEFSLSDDFKKVRTVINKFPEVTFGFGKLNIQVKLNIGNNVKPVLQHISCAPFHMHQKIRSKTGKLIKLDVIEAVSWISLLLAIPKGDDIGVVADMRKPNTVKQKHHPIPTVDETFEKFNQSKVFSKIDLLHRYEIELNP